jgi:hypothetical protein
MDEDIYIGDYAIRFEDGTLTVKRGQLEVRLDKVDESVFISSKGLHSVRITSINSTLGGGISPTANYPPNVFGDKVEYKITRYNGEGAQIPNEIFVGKEGYFYQWGPKTSKVEDKD